MLVAPVTRVVVLVRQHALVDVLLQGAGRHDLGDEDDLARVDQVKVGEEGEDVLVLERLEDVDLGVDLRGLLLADALHVHLAPRDLDALLLVVALEDRLERAVAERVIMAISRLSIIKSVDCSTNSTSEICRRCATRSSFLHPTTVI